MMKNKNLKRENKRNWQLEIIKTKKESYYHEKQKYILLILLGTALFLLMALLIEFDVFDLSYHKTFLTNIFLGLSISGIVVSSVLFIPFHLRKKQYILDLKKQACKVFFEYDKIYNQLKANPDETKENIELLNYIDKCKRENSTILDNEKNAVYSEQLIEDAIIDIHKFRKMFDESPFYSEYILEMLDVIEKKVLPSIELINRLVDSVPKQLEGIKHAKLMSDRYMELLCKCNNIVADIADKHYKYSDVLNAFRHVVEEVGCLVNAEIAHATCHDVLIMRFKDTVQDVMIQNAKIELSKSIILELDKLTRTIENN